MESRKVGTSVFAIVGAAWIVALCGSDSSWAESTSISGRWTSIERECSAPTDGLVKVSEDALEAHEYVCKFFGGDTSDPRHWTVRGRCSGEGEYEEGGQPPLTQIDIIQRGGVLTIQIGNDKPWKLAIKCR